MRGERLYDREGVRSEDQPTLQECASVASGGTGAGRDASSNQGGWESVLDDSTQRLEEVQSTEAGQANEGRERKDTQDHEPTNEDTQGLSFVLKPRVN